MQSEHVVFKAETEVIPCDLDLSPVPKPSAKSKKARKSSKPILVNKGEAPSDADDAEVTRPRSNSFGHIRPRDELELKFLQETEKRSKEEPEVAQPKAACEEPAEGVRQRRKAPKQEEKAEIEAEVKKEVSTPQHTPLKKQKKPKSDSMNVTGELRCLSVGHASVIANSFIMKHFKVVLISQLFSDISSVKLRPSHVLCGGEVLFSSNLFLQPILRFPEG